MGSRKVGGTTPYRDSRFEIEMHRATDISIIDDELVGIHRRVMIVQRDRTGTSTVGSIGIDWHVQEIVIVIEHDPARQIRLDARVNHIRLAV